MPHEPGFDYLTHLRRRWRWVVALTLVGIGVAVAITSVTPKRYTATAQVYVATNTGSSAEDLSTGSTFTQAQMQSYASLARSGLVLSPVASEFGISGGAGALGGDVGTSVSTGSVVMDISVSDASGGQAATLANAVAASLAQHAPALQSSSRGQSAPVKITTIQSAAAPGAPSSPKLKLNLAVGAFIGLVCGILIAVMRGIFDVRIKTADDLSTLTSVPLLGSVPESRKRLKHAVVFGDRSSGPLAEAYRILRTGLQFVRLQRTQTNRILITSSVPSEGKTLTSLNLAAAFAEAGRRTVFLEADLRRPRLAEALELGQPSGLTDILLGNVDVGTAVQELPDLPGLGILVAGALPPNPSELLGSRRFEEILEQLDDQFDAVVIDSPPLTLLTDASVLATKVDMVVLVVGAGRVRRDELRGSLRHLEMVEAPVGGLVMNRVKETRRRGGYYGGYYGGIDKERPASSNGSRRDVEAGTVGR